MSSVFSCTKCGGFYMNAILCPACDAYKKYENATLNERESTHGDYAVTADIAQSLKARIRYYNKADKLTVIQKESLDMICTKIARILSGDADCKDSWDDIAGYANLVSERLK